MHSRHVRRIAFTFALAGALTLSLARPARAQEHSDFSHAYQTWLQFSFQGPIYQDLFLIADLQYRGYDDFSPVATIVRAQLAWRPMDGMFLGAGYMWQPVWRGHGATLFADEHRLYQNWQWELVHPDVGIRFQMRFRVEERFRYPTGTTEVGVRFRQMLRFMFPLTHDRALSIITYDEFFINGTDSGHTPDGGIDAMGNETFSPTWEYFGYDQNRYFIGMGYQVVPSVLRFELGYLNQWVRRPNNAAGDLMNHVAVLNTVINWR